MKEITKLLIAYDGSTCSDAALADLKRAGLPEHLEALVMTVAALIFLPPDEQLRDDEVISPAAATMVTPLQQQAREALRHAEAIAEQGAARVKKDFPGWAVSYRAEGESPAWTLIKTAASVHADLIVAGAHHHSSLGGRLIMGSVSQRVLYEAACTVRLARCSSPHRDGPVRIVVGFNPATESEVAVDAVAARAWPVGTEVRLVAAGDAVRLDEQQQKLHAAGLKVSEVLKHGDPVHVLIHEAEEWDADSIFVGTRNVHGIQRLLRGSVASAIAARAQCSVEVVRTARHAA